MTICQQPPRSSATSDLVARCSRMTTVGERKATAALGVLLRGGPGLVRAMRPAEVRSLITLFLANRELVLSGCASLRDFAAAAVAHGLPIAVPAEGAELVATLEVSGGPHRLVLRGERGADGMLPTLRIINPQPLIIVHDGEVVLENLQLQQMSPRHGVDAEALHVAGLGAAVTCRRVLLHSHSDCGVCVTAGRLQMTDCAIQDCGGTGLILFGGKAQLRRTAVERNGRCGVYARNSCLEFLGGNHIADNGHSGIFFAADTKGLWMKGNRLRHNGQPAVRLLEHCALDGWEQHNKRRRPPQAMSQGANMSINVNMNLNMCMPRRGDIPGLGATTIAQS